jgi:hypothetical protein
VPEGVLTLLSGPCSCLSLAGVMVIIMAEGAVEPSSQPSKGRGGVNHHAN